MEKNIEISRIQEITRLHLKIAGYIKVTLEIAIRIGELLMEQKAEMRHGEFIPWIKANLPFAERTARNYLRVYDNRERLKTARVADLTEAYKLLEEPKQILQENERTWIMMLETREQEGEGDEYECVIRKREKRVKLIKITDIIQRKDFYAREGEFNWDHMKFLADHYLGDLPPIEINQKNILIDGWHRLEAHKYAGKEYIRCFVTIVKKPEDKIEMLELSIIRNAAHGHPFNENNLVCQNILRERIRKEEEVNQHGNDRQRNEGFFRPA